MGGLNIKGLSVNNRDLRDIPKRSKIVLYRAGDEQNTSKIRAPGLLEDEQ